MEIVRYLREEKPRKPGGGRGSKTLRRKASLQKLQVSVHRAAFPQERRAGWAVLSPRETETQLKRDTESVYRGKNT